MKGFSLSLFTAFAPILIAFLGVAFGYGKLKATLIKRKECEQYRSNCVGIIAVCKKIDEIKILITIMDNKRETAREEINKEFLKLSSSLSELRGYIHGVDK